jgi:hypothetical protein
LTARGTYATLSAVLGQVFAPLASKEKGRRMRPVLALLVAIALSAAARAEGLDRDTLLTDAPAVPDQGTVRITGGVVGTTATEGVGNTQGQANISGSIGWTPIRNLSGDVGAYYQIGAQGPSARLRYQILSQDRAGLDLAAGVRFKTVGFHPDKGEVEFLIAGGRRFGQFELVLNGAFGVETGGESGKDVELKGFAGWRFSDAVRAGLDTRLQAEIEDEAASTAPKIGRDYDLTAGPAVSWMVSRTIQVQALVGMVQPKKTDRTSPVGVFTASIDF